MQGSSGPSPSGTTYGVAFSQAEPKPRAAAYLVAVGGAFVFLEALLTGVILTLLIGFFLFVVAALIHGEPHHHLANGILAVFLAFLSIVFGFGGFYFGAVLSAVGGVMAIVWSPPKAVLPSNSGSKRARLRA